MMSPAAEDPERGADPGWPPSLAEAAASLRGLPPRTQVGLDLAFLIARGDRAIARLEELLVDHLGG